MAILWPQPSFMASGHILPSLTFLANFHFTNPQAFIFDFGPGGPPTAPMARGLWFTVH
ncbi:hypothetical protein O181_085225, partial [Austropuccinia psidii MF-1]|nr:hypothetical protein [Austropuccinia psidii MF-1]